MDKCTINKPIQLFNYYYSINNKLFIDLIFTTLFSKFYNKR